MAEGYRIFIDQDDCTGCGKCEEDCPELFVMWNSGKGSDGLAYVKNASDRGYGPDGPKLRGIDGLAVVPDRLIDDVVEIISDCPGDCIGIIQGESC